MKKKRQSHEEKMKKYLKDLKRQHYNEKKEEIESLKKRLAELEEEIKPYI